VKLALLLLMRMCKNNTIFMESIQCELSA
jgi:hypothetical protein